MELPVAEIWYGIEPHTDGVIRLRETHIHPYWSGSIWLVRGAERDLVIDSGTGMVPLGPVIAAISDEPALAVALCHYYDHAGGLYSFEERACHPLEAESLTVPPQTWKNFVGTNALSALPYSGFQIQDYAMSAAPPTRLLEEGAIIDLGARCLEVLHIPGRTPGSLALWESARGFLFGGETLFIDPDRFDFPPKNVALYEASLRRLGELPVTTVFGGHYGGFSAAELHNLINDETGCYRESASDR
jgi:glyoxylase-like metal-dependent hydrolase (beta-lactamase superfamily II)